MRRQSLPFIALLTTLAAGAAPEGERVPLPEARTVHVQTTDADVLPPPDPDIVADDPPVKIIHLEPPEDFSAWFAQEISGNPLDFIRLELHGAGNSLDVNLEGLLKWHFGVFGWIDNVDRGWDIQVVTSENALHHNDEYMIRGQLQIRVRPKHLYVLPFEARVASEEDEDAFHGRVLTGADVTWSTPERWARDGD